MATTFSGLVLVVDDDALFQQSLARQLRRHGLECVTAESYEAALHMIDRMPELRCALLDNIAGALPLSDVVRHMRQARPDVILVGNSGSERRQEFARAGISEYLQKPWPAQELLAVLRGAIGPCADCQLPLPLRRVTRGEYGQTWICTGCGSRYYAVLDELADAKRRLNVRAERPSQDG